MKTQPSPTSAEETTQTPGAALIGDEWAQALARIPVDLEATAKATRALQRKREIRSAADLLRLVLAYALCDWSARFVGAWATIMGLGTLSDVAVRKRLRGTRQWLGQLVSEWVQLHQAELPVLPRRLRIVDATHVRQPGSVGTDWRLHVGVNLATLGLDSLEITDAHGGEGLARLAVQAGDIVVADRAYPHREAVGQMVFVHQADVILRSNVHNFPLQTAEGTPLEIHAWLATVLTPEPTEITGWIQTAVGRVEIRVIAGRLPPEQAARARQRVWATARKKGHTPSVQALLAADFIVLVTSLRSVLVWPAAQLLAIYRFRWQIELLFKRWKSVLALAHLRAQDPELAQVYLLGKIVGALLLDSTLGECHPGCAAWWANPARPVSPWRWLVLGVELMRTLIRGPLTLARVLAVLLRLTRYLCDAPRKRKQQLALAQQWLRAFGLAPSP